MGTCKGLLCCRGIRAGAFVLCSRLHMTAVAAPGLRLAGGERRRIFRVRIFAGGRFIDVPECWRVARVGCHAHGVGQVSV